ncbi:HIRAN domain-containing protein [Algiphilus sp.]|uniref:HIRAN domain-containing protein n=1 Tax=Algiphilus sp. TaxID=1872431 RepID=UPI0032EC9173
MEKTYLVKIRGVSYHNEDGTSRQELIARCRRNETLTLRAEPNNPHDRHAVACLNSDGHQLGWLKSDARDASSVLRGEPISAKVEKVIGGSHWWHRLVGQQRQLGLVARITKGDIDWGAHNRHREIAEKVDFLVNEALAYEKSSPIEKAIAKYQTALDAVIDLNKDSPTAAANRYQEAPINRLTMLLVRQKWRQEALEAYDRWESVIDPVGLTKGSKDALAKRIAKLRGKGAAAT